MTTINPLYRFGLPEGSAIILLGLREIINPIMNLVIDYGGSIANDLMDPKREDSDPYENVWLVLLLLYISIVSICLGYGVILKGDRRFMVGWMTLSSVCIGLFMILEFVFFDWSFSSANVALNNIYLIILFLAIFAYELNFGLRCLPLFTNISDLEPIGKGWQFIVDYYKTHSKEAAAIVLMFEIWLNSDVLFDRHMTRFVFGHEFMGHEHDKNPAVLTEETVIRYIRIGLSIIGFFIVYKEKKYWMFRFCICYIATIAISLGIFIYLIFVWRSEHIFLTLLYFSMLTVNLLYRTGVLYVCVRYTDVFERSGIPM